MNITLKSTDPVLAEIAAYSREITKRHPATVLIDAPFTNIVAVGSVCDTAGIRGISPRDKHWIKLSRDACKDVGLNWAPDFTLAQPNIATNKIDFLDPKIHIPADMLVVCFVPTRSHAERIHKEHNKNLPQDLQLGYAQSPHNGRMGWQAAAKQSGARMIVTYSSGKEERGHFVSAQQEIDANYFTGKNYVLYSQERVRYTDMVDAGSAYTGNYCRSVILRSDLYTQIASARGLSHNAL